MRDSRNLPVVVNEKIPLNAYRILEPPLTELCRMWIPGDLPHRRRRRLPALHARLPLLQVGGRLRRRPRGRGPRRRHTSL